MSWFDYPGDYSWQASFNGGDVTFKNHPLQLTFVMNFKIFKIQKIQKFFWECTHLHLNSTKYIDYPKYLLKCSWEYKCVFYLHSNAICIHTLRYSFRHYEWSISNGPLPLFSPTNRFFGKISYLTENHSFVKNLYFRAKIFALLPMNNLNIWLWRP